MKVCGVAGAGNGAGVASAGAAGAGTAAVGAPAIVERVEDVLGGARRRQNASLWARMLAGAPALVWLDCKGIIPSIQGTKGPIDPQ